MTDFEKILSLILEKNPTRLIVKPTTKTLIAGFGIKKIIKLSDYTNYLEFKENVKKELSSRGIGFGSLFFDIDKNIKSNLWKDFEQAEFTFTNSLLRYENNKLSIINDNDNLKSYFSNCSKYNNNRGNSKSSLKNIKYEQWKNLVEKAKKEINNSNLEKIVVAEMKRESIDNFDLKSTILYMIEKYPNCTTYLYKMKDSIFFGSTPEMIFEYTNKILKTEAIAGSIPNKGEKTEEIKRKFENTTLIEEHKIVSEYIEKQLLKISSNKITRSDLEVKKLNNINHLQSKIEVEIKDNDFFEFISLLHPSPALAGFPVNDAKKWIKNNENFDRGLYAGSIGYVENDNSNFYAALRCAMYNNSRSEIVSFAGNGIVKDSKVNYEIDELNSKFKAINESIIEN
ncbi:MAG: isochorismate synthase [SAR202 cluster bacterium]|nr:isochorismate synthase [SAR202 cluster bacterium]|tara:strand:- start:475 stop:1668 length:1194 start_codon:yes stop_codon:yes gene_type:complete